MIRFSAVAAIACSLSFAMPAAPKAQGNLQAQPQAEGCPRLVSSTQPRVLPATVNAEELALTFVGHATFLMETPAGLTVATDYNDYVKPPIVPNVVTMNRAHSTHYSNHPDAGIKHVLRGWNVSGGPAAHDVTIGDMRIRNVVTNIRDWQGGTDYAGNSIFVFEASQLCVAHLGHLHHELTDEHIKQLGRIDVALVPVDGSYTLSTEQMFKVVQQISPQLVIPMHFFSQSTLRRFLDMAREQYPVEMSQTPSIVLSRQMLPIRTKVLVLPGR
jgi:L-ascorbate metabolism protein UlaG (beta-lactamase superfamily)